MRAAAPRGVSAAVLLLAAALGGCADLLREARLEAEREAAPVTWPDTNSRDERERILNLAWVGRTRQELLRSYGTPQLVMDVPGRRIPDTFVMVYKGRDPVGRCIDAFVILNDGSERIRDYFCR